MLIVCKVTAGERDAWSFAREALRRRDTTVDVRFVDSTDALVSERPAIAAISLLPEVDGPRRPLGDVAERLRSDIRSLEKSKTRVFLCNIFRACVDEQLLERIRRLNLLAAEISHETGAGVIDVDRSFAHLGARTLETDYRLEGRRAAELGGKVIAEMLLAYGIDA